MKNFNTKISKFPLECKPAMNHYPVTKNSPAKFGNLCKFSQEKEEI